MWTNEWTQIHNDGIGTTRNSILDANESRAGFAAFMGDGSLTHTPPMCQKYRQAHEVENLPWPAESPDLNPNENLWRIMNYRIASQMQGRPRDIEQMKQLLRAEWDIDWIQVCGEN